MLLRMRESNFENKQSIFLMVILYTTLLVVVTVLILSSVLYKAYRNILLNQIYNTELQSMSHLGFGVKHMTDSVNSLALQLFTDINIRELLYDNFDTISVEKLKKVSRQLEAARITMHYIDSIYILNLNSKIIILPSSGWFSAVKCDKNNFPDKEMLNILDNFSKYKNYIPIPRKIPQNGILSSIESEFGVYTYIYSELPLSKQKLDTSIVVNISKLWLEDLLKELGSDSTTLIVDYEGKVIANVGNEDDYFLRNISEQPYIDKIIQGTSNSGHFVDNYHGTKSLIIFSKYEWLNWLFIKIIPYNALMGRVKYTAQITILICTIILVCSVIMCIAVSRKIYSPIDALFTKIKSLEDERQRNNRALKEEYLKSIVNGNIYIKDMDIINERFKELNIYVDINSTLVIVLCKIDKFDEISKIKDEKSLMQYKYMLLHFAQKVFKKHFRSEVFEVEKDSILAILNIDENDILIYKSSISIAVDEFRKEISSYTDNSITAVIGCPFNNISHIANEYSQIIAAAKYRLYYGYESNIFQEETTKYEIMENIYPVKTEKQFLEAVISGDIEEIRKLYDEIIKAIINNPFDIFHSYIMRLAFEFVFVLKQILNEKVIQCEVETLYEYSSFVDNIENARTISKINTIFYSAFDDILRYRNIIKDNRYQRISDKVIKHINTYYSDQNLCIANIANEFGYSAAYLGQIFSSETSKSIIDYINEVRIKEAKNLLNSTNYTIEMVSSKVGFTNVQYFHKVFKNKCGLTPNEFRHL